MCWRRSSNLDFSLPQKRCKDHNNPNIFAKDLCMQGIATTALQGSAPATPKDREKRAPLTKSERSSLCSSGERTNCRAGLGRSLTALDSMSSLLSCRHVQLVPQRSASLKPKPSAWTSSCESTQTHVSSTSLTAQALHSDAQL